MLFTASSTTSKSKSNSSQRSRTRGKATVSPSKMLLLQVVVLLMLLHHRNSNSFTKQLHQLSLVKLAPPTTGADTGELLEHRANILSAGTRRADFNTDPVASGTIYKTQRVLTTCCRWFAELTVDQHSLQVVSSPHTVHARQNDCRQGSSILRRVYKGSGT